MDANGRFVLPFRSDGARSSDRRRLTATASQFISSSSPGTRLLLYIVLLPVFGFRLPVSVPTLACLRLLECEHPSILRKLRRGTASGPLGLARSPVAPGGGLAVDPDQALGSNVDSALLKLAEAVVPD